MRRTQSVRNRANTSLALTGDDLGILRETGEDTLEDVLRRQLLEKDRENDKLQNQIVQLKSQLADRPPLEAVQGLQREYTNLEILLQGTQRENERCMAELDRAKSREKALEAQLEKLAGPNWQTNLDISPSSFISARSGFMSPAHTRSGSIPQLSSPSNSSPSPKNDPEVTKAYIEQVRLLILGMEQRLQSREEKLMKTVERAESESARYEEARKQALAT